MLSLSINPLLRKVLRKATKGASRKAMSEDLSKDLKRTDLLSYDKLLLILCKSAFQHLCHLLSRRSPPSMIQHNFGILL